VIAILFLFPFKMTGGGIIAVYLIIMALMMGPVSPVLLAAVPEVMPSPQTIGIGMGVAAFGQQLGMYIGPSLFGKLLGTMTMPEWHTTAYIMVPICAVGIILAALTKVR
jgi:MFS family permease